MCFIYLPVVLEGLPVDLRLNVWTPDPPTQECVVQSQKVMSVVICTLHMFKGIKDYILSKCALGTYLLYFQVYLLTSVSLFALPTLLPGVFSGTYQILTLPYILPIAHIGIVRYQPYQTTSSDPAQGWLHLQQPCTVHREVHCGSPSIR